MKIKEIAITGLVSLALLSGCDTSEDTPSKPGSQASSVPGVATDAGKNAAPAVKEVEPSDFEANDEAQFPNEQMMDEHDMTDIESPVADPSGDLEEIEDIDGEAADHDLEEEDQGDADTEAAEEPKPATVNGQSPAKTQPKK